MGEQPGKPKMLVPDPDWPYPGPGTVSLYCDECGELYCEHRPAPGARGQANETEEGQG